MTPSLRTRILSAVIFFVLIASAVFTVPARADSGSPPPAPSAPGGTTHSSAQAPAGATNTVGGGDQGHKVELSSQNAAYIAPAGDPIWCPSGVAVPVPGAGGCSINYPNLYSLTNDVETGIIHPVVTNSNIWIQHGADTSASQILLDGSVLAALSNVSLNFKGGWNGLGTGSVNPATPSMFTGVGIKIANWHNDVTLSNITVNKAPIGQDGLDVQSTRKISLTNIVLSNGKEYGAKLDNSTGTGVTVTNSFFLNNDLNLDFSYGLWVQSNGPITVTNVNASGNDYNGAYLDNSIASGPQNLTLSGTNIFDDNQSGGYGLNALSKGTITSSSIIASNNFASGAIFDNTTASTALPVTLTGTGTFNGNGTFGLKITSNGPISVINLLADGNFNEGAILQNNFGTTIYSPVKVNGTNEFAGNGYTGLAIISHGAITLNNITANGNGTVLSSDGMFANNAGANTAQSITLTGSNNFNLNNLDGATLFASGKVSVSNVTAIGNKNGAGFLVNNSFLGSPQSVTLLGKNLLTNNHTDNLDVATHGTITIINLTANDSQTGYGANLYFNLITSGSVALQGVNTFNNNGSTGLNIYSNGAVLLPGLTAISNAGAGIDIVNTASTIASPVTLKGLTTVSYNGPVGLVIVSKGAITTNGLTILSNLGDGAFIGNNQPGFASPVTLNGLNTINNNSGDGLTINSFGTVMLKGKSTFNYNGLDGLNITTKGAVLTSGLTADTNAIGGVSIVNSASLVGMTVTLNGINLFNNNGAGGGLNITASGTVTANSMTALSNSGAGVLIVNNFLTTASPVTLKGLTTVSYNGPVGLDISSKGAITTNGLTAISNGQGAYLSNNFPSFTSPVTMNGVNTLNNNGANGLDIFSNEAVMLKGKSTFNYNGFVGLNISTKGGVVTSGLTADSNGNQGVSINNNLPLVTAHPVTLNGINTFNNNGAGGGLSLTASGAVIASSVTALTNGGAGVLIVNNFLTTASPVTLKGLTTVSYNGPVGLDISSKGAITTNGLTAISNGQGAYLSNNFPSFTSPVTMNGVNTLNNNGANGLDIFSNEAVMLKGKSTFNYNGFVGLNISTKGGVVTSGLTADSNGNQGVSINNNLPLVTAHPVTLNGINTFNNNGAGGGLSLTASGAVIASSVTALTNGGAGVLIVNNFLTTASPVTLKGLTTVSYNGPVGLDISSKGAITTNGLTAISNGQGAYLSNNFPSFTSPVTMNGVNTLNNNGANGLDIFSNEAVMLKGKSTFNYNGFVGLNISTKGGVVTSGLTADSNGNQGVSINNDLPLVTAHPVTLNGVNTFNNNGVGGGLNLDASGAVIANSVTALTNSGPGAMIMNGFLPVASPVTLKGLTKVNYNGPVGLEISSNGTVITNGLTAVSNGNGIFIINNLPSFALPVTLNGVNTFNHNAVDGLDIFSNGVILANTLTATSNGGNGVYIKNDTSTISAPVTLLGLDNFNFNGVIGLNLLSKGTVTTNGLMAMNNGGDGVFINNTASSFAPVTLKGFDVLKNNGGNGLDISSNGTILLNGLNASNNAGNGANLSNFASGISAPVTLNGSYTFDLNGGYGLNLFSKGLITVNNLTANDNAGMGAWIQNNSSGISAGINIKGKNVIWDNGFDGLHLVSKGPITMTNISAKLNYDDGIYVDTLSNVIVSCGSFVGNGEGHVTGYGWEMGAGVLTLHLIGVTAAGNFSGDSHLNGATLVTVTPHSCVLP